MALNLNGSIVRWPDGTEGTVHQDECTRDSSGRHAFVASLKIERENHAPVTGKLRYTDDAWTRLPGKDDSKKSEAIGTVLRNRTTQKELQDGFFFMVEADDDGVRLAEP